MKYFVRVISSCLMGFCLTPGGAYAQEWKPTTAVEFIVPSGPGGAADQYARAMGAAFQKMDLLGGQAWVPQNRSSGTGVVALQALQQKPGNPHSMTLLHTGINVSNLTGELKLTTADFTPTTVFLRETMALTVKADSKFGNAREFVEQVKRDPGSVRIGYLGHHVLLSLAKPLKAAGVDIKKLTLVPYKSTAEALTALLGGFVDAVPGSTPNLLGMITGGRVRALAVSSDERLGGAFANVPTWREQGIDSSFSSVYGILLPKGVSQDAVHYWEAAFQKLSANPDWITLLERNGAHPVYWNQRQTIEYLAKERQDLAPLVKDLGLGAN